MYRLPTKIEIVLLVGIAWGQAQQTDAAAPKPVSREFHSSTEMGRLYHAFLGSWRVTESFEVSSEQQGKTRQGRARFRVAPGPSLVEEYKSTGSAGSLNAVSFFWWDEPAHIYRLLTCANNYGCQLRGVVKWEGNVLVNSWEDTVDGKTAVFRDSA